MAETNETINTTGSTNIPYHLVTTEDLVEAHKYALTLTDRGASALTRFEAFCRVIGLPATDGNNYYGYYTWDSVKNAWTVTGKYQVVTNRAGKMVEDHTMPQLWLACDSCVINESSGEADDTSSVITERPDCHVWCITPATDFSAVEEYLAAKNNEDSTDDISDTRSGGEYMLLSSLRTYGHAGDRYITLRVFEDSVIDSLTAKYSLGSYSYVYGDNTALYGAYGIVDGRECSVDVNSEYATVLGSDKAQVINGDHNTILGAVNVTIQGNSDSDRRESDYNAVLGATESTIVDSSGITLLHGSTYVPRYRGAAISESAGAIVFNEPECNINNTFGGVYQTSGRVESSNVSIVLDRSKLDADTRLTSPSQVSNITTTVVLSGDASTGIDVSDCTGSVVVGQNGGKVSNLTNSIVIGTDGSIGEANNYINDDDESTPGVKNVSIESSVVSVSNPDSSIPQVKFSAVLGNGSASSTANGIYDSLVTMTSDIGTPISDVEKAYIGTLTDPNAKDATGVIKSSSMSTTGMTAFAGNIEYDNLAFGGGELNSWSPVSFMRRVESAKASDFARVSSILGAGYGNIVDFGVTNAVLAGTNNRIASDSNNVAIIGNDNFGSRIKYVYSVKELTDMMSADPATLRAWMAQHAGQFTRGEVAVVSDRSLKYSTLTLYNSRGANEALQAAYTVTVPDGGSEFGGWDVVVGIYLDQDVSGDTWTWGLDDEIGKIGSNEYNGYNAITDTGKTGNAFVPMMIGDNWDNAQTEYYKFCERIPYSFQDADADDQPTHTPVPHHGIQKRSTVDTADVWHTSMLCRVKECREYYLNACKINNLLCVGNNNSVNAQSANSVIIGNGASVHNMKLLNSFLTNCGDDNGTREEYTPGMLRNTLWYGTQDFIDYSSNNVKDSTQKHDSLFHGLKFGTLDDVNHIIENDREVADGLMGVSDMFVFTGGYKYHDWWFNMPGTFHEWSDTATYTDSNGNKKTCRLSVVADGRDSTNAPMLYTGGLALSAPVTSGQDVPNYGLIKLGSACGLNGLAAGVVDAVVDATDGTAIAIDGNADTLLDNAVKGMPIVSLGRYGTDGTQKIQFGKLNNPDAFDRNTLINVIGITSISPDGSASFTQEYSSGHFITVDSTSASTPSIGLNFSLAEYSKPTGASYEFTGHPVTMTGDASGEHLCYCPVYTSSDLETTWGDDPE